MISGESNSRYLKTQDLIGDYADLLVVFVFLLLTAVAVVQSNWRPVTDVFVIPLLFFLPGYVTTIVIFPTTEHHFNPKLFHQRGEESSSDDTISVGERLVYSFGLSTVITVLVARVLVTTTWGLSEPAFLATISGYLVCVTVVGVIRRARARPDRRFTPIARLLDGKSWLQAIELRPVFVLVVVALIFTCGSVAFAVAGPVDRASYTEFYILNDTSDGFTASDYPERFSVDLTRNMTVSIENHEGDAVKYTVVALAQRVNTSSGTTSVVEEGRLWSDSIRVGADQTVRRRHSVAPQFSGERVRLLYLLYRGDPPENPTRDDAYRATHLWISVTGPGDVAGNETTS